MADISVKEGKKDGLHGDFGVGILTSHVALEGPLAPATNNGLQHTWLFAGRLSYIGLLLTLFTGGEIDLYFIDALTKFNFELSKQDKLSFTAYSSFDVLGLSNIFALYFYNGLFSTRWDHSFSDRLTLRSTLGLSNYGTWTTTNLGSAFSFNLQSGITDYVLREELKYQVLPNLALNTGFDFVFRNTRPGVFTPGENAFSALSYYAVEAKKSLESGLFAAAEYTPLQWLALTAGGQIITL